MRSMRRVSVAVAVIGLTGGAPASAQHGDSLQVGIRYRVTLPEFADRPGPQFPQSRWIAGALVGRRADSLVLRPHPTTGAVAIPVSSIARLERSRGVSRGASAVEGAVGGALVGAMFGLLLYDLDLRAPGFNTRWQAAGTTAAWSAGAGLLTGLVFPTERWKGVARPTP